MQFTSGDLLCKLHFGLIFSITHNIYWIELENTFWDKTEYLAWIAEKPRFHIFFAFDESIIFIQLSNEYHVL